MENSSSLSSLDLHDEILLLRGDSLYRSRLGELSSIIATFAMLSRFNEEIDRLSALIDTYNSDQFIEKNFYTKTEVKETFATIANVDALTANETYVFKTDATKLASTLSTESQLTAWRNSTFVEHSNTLYEGYKYTDNAWNDADKNITDKAQAHIQNFKDSIDSDADW